MFDEILIPESVSQEILAGDANDLAIQKLPKLSWIKTVPDTKSNPLTANYNLGKGEIAAINLALENAPSKVILDDFAARKCAKDLKVPFIGTGGLLIRAKQEKLIPYVSNALIKVQNNGLWLSDSIIELIKQKAGE